MNPESTIVLFGGPGSERLVSVASAQNIAAHHSGQWWFWGPSGELAVVSREELLAHQNPFTEEFVPTPTFRFKTLEDALDAESSKALQSVFFLALHGDSGEDGTVQRLFEKRGLLFTGSGSTASEIAFDKLRAKEIAEACGARVAASRTIDTADEGYAKTIRDALATLGPIVVKPTQSGSSDGLSMISNDGEAESAIQALATRSPGTYLVEKRIVGTEITVGVVERETGLVGLPCSEVRLPVGAAFDYAGKYLGKSEEITPAEISESLAREAQRIAQMVHEKIGCRGYSRTDMILGADGFVFLEINTLPGLSKASFIPQQLRVAKIPFEDFLFEQCAIARHKAGAQ